MGKSDGMMRFLAAAFGVIMCMAAMAQNRDVNAVDVHSHLMTKPYLECLERHGALMEDGFPLPAWSEDGHLAFMDSLGIVTSVLTLSSPYPYFGDIEETKALIRSVNEEGTAVKQRHPGRFKYCASVPLPDVNASIQETIYALDSLKADGIKLPTNSRGLYLGDPTLDPLMKELNDRKAVVIIHPHRPESLPDRVFTSGPIFVYEYPAETTRAVLNMVAHNIMTRYPEIKFVVPHAGSFLPTAVARLKNSYPLMSAMGLIEQSFDIDANIRNLYYDVAGGPSAEILDLLLTITDQKHILYGSDYSFVPAKALEKAYAGLMSSIDNNERLSPYKEQILRDNALALFGGDESYSNLYVPELQCKKLPMAEDGIIRLSRIEVYPQHLDEYMKMATEVGATSLRTEPGVLTMYAVADKNNPCLITILETYASKDAYKSHIASPHFQKYKQGTLHMVKSLELCDQTPLNPDNKIINKIN